MTKFLGNLNFKLTITLGILIGIFIPAIFSAYVLSQSVKEEGLKHIEQRAEILANSYSNALWYFSDEWMESITNGATSVYNDIAFIYVDDSKVKTALFEKFETKDSDALITFKKPIVYQNENIGELEVSYLKSKIEEQYFSEIKSVIYVVLVQVVASILILFPIFYFKMGRRIKRLLENADTLQAGRIDRPFIWEEKDEFGAIGRAFEGARVALSQYFHEIESANDSLKDALSEAEDAKEDALDAHNKLQDSYTKLGEQKSKISLLLNNSGEGFLLVGENHLIDSEYSLECENIFEKEISQCMIDKILYPKDSQNREKFSGMLDSLFKTDDMDRRELILSLFPQEIFYDDEKVQKYLTLHYKLVQSNKIMLIVRDITTQKVLQERIKSEQLKLKVLVNALKDQEGIIDIVRDFRSYLKGKSALSLFEEYRVVHTFKGAFLQYDFSYVPKVLHEYENELSKLIKEKRRDADLALKARYQKELEKILDRDIDTIKELFGEEFFEGVDYINVKKEDIVELEKRIDRVAKDNHHEEKALDEMNTILLTLRSFTYKPFKKLIARYPKLAQNLATRLGKEIHFFDIEGGNFKVDPSRYSPFCKSLIHIFRNALDHGIETPEERVEAQKSESGIIYTKAYLDANNIVLEIGDDGRGIDVEVIKKQAKLSNKIIDEENPYLVIFEEAFSTKESITDISGRGIGLNAVKVECEKLGGTIEVRSVLGEGTTFIFKLPKTDVFANLA